jgi:hypothetical protein
MKKLSEIGTPHWQLYNMPSQEADYIKFTPAERRELVEQSVLQFILDHVGSDLPREEFARSVKKFLEEQGI